MIAKLPTRGMGLFSLIWLGQAISFVGSAMTGFALGVKVFQQTGSVTRFALIGLSAALPTLLVSPFAGALADRFDRRLILIGAQIGSVLSNSVLLWLIVTDQLTPSHIYPLVAVGALFGSFSWPTFGAAVTSIVSKADFARASGMLQMGASISSISGPLLAGLLLEPIGLAGIVRLNIASFLIAIAILTVVRIPPPLTRTAPAPGPAADPGGGPDPASAIPPAPARPAPFSSTGMASGWHFIRAHPGLLQLLLTFAVINFAVGMVQVLITPLILSFSNARVLGLVASIASSGALVGGTVMSVWGGSRRRIPLIFTIASIQGILLMVGGLQANPTLITAAAFFYLLGFPITTGSSQAIWQSKTPPEIQGRVFAIRRMVAGSSIPLAQAVAGPLADHVFEPLLATRTSALAGSVGTFIGVGPGRGIGLMYVLLGLIMAVGAFVLGRNRTLRTLETDIPDAVADTPGIAGSDRVSTTVKASPALAWAPALALLALLVGLGVTASHWGMRPPSAVGENAPLDQFSAARALRHTAAISQVPHPIASPAQAEATRYLADTLASLGLEVDVQRTDTALDTRQLASMMTVDNVMGRWVGTGADDGTDGTRRTIALVAHYDSIPSAPGAADNGSGVGALIEAVRALKAGPPLRNDIVVVFTDGEEAGLQGAHAFLKQHPWARDVALAVNVDARGNEGAAFVFETGDENGWWIPKFARAVPYPSASSIMSALYDRLPNATDFTLFRKAGWAGFNIAPVGGLTHYHNESDRLEDVDPRTVQHQGSYVLALARAAGDLDLSAPAESRRQPNRAYFTILGHWLLHYASWLAWLSALGVMVAYAWIVRAGLRRRTLTPFGLVQGFLAAFAMVVSIPVAVTLLWMVVRDAGSVPVIMGSTEAAPLFMIAFAAFATGAVVVLQRFFRTSVGLLDLLIGGIGWWLILIVLSTGTALPAVTNFLVVWPTVGALVGAAYLVRTPSAVWSSGRTSLVLAAAAVPALLLLPPFIATGYIALQSLFQLGGASLLPLVLLLVLLVAQLEAASAGRRWLIPALGALVGVVFLALAMTRTSHVPDAALSSTLYIWDTEADTRTWHSVDRELTDWTRAFGFDLDNRSTTIAKVFPLIPSSMVAPAPVVPLDQPTVTLLDSSEVNGIRRYRLTIEATPTSLGRLLAFEPREPVLSVRIDDQTLSTAAPTVLVARLPVRPVETLEVRVRGDEPIRMIVSEQSPGLPPGAGAPARGPHDLTRPLLAIVRSDVTFVRTVIELSPTAVASAQETVQATSEVPTPASSLATAAGTDSARP